MLKILGGYILLYFVIISGSIFLSYKYNKKTCQTLAPTLLLSMALLYVFGLFGILKIGVYFICSLFFILAIYAIIRIIVNKNFKSFFKNNISEGLMIFTGIYFLFALTTYKKTFYIWDEFTLWSVACKNMYILDDFITNSNSTVFLPYPPSPTILQYFFTKVIGIYSQGIELFTLQILGFSLLFPLLKSVNKTSVKIITTIIIMSIPAIFVESLFYYTIYVDTLLGLIIGYVLFNYFTDNSREEFSILSFALCIIAIALIKSSGFFIALILIGILGLYHILIEKQKTNNFLNFVKNLFKWKHIKTVLILLIVCFITYMSWNVHVNLKADSIRVQNESTKTYEGNPIKYVAKTFINSFLGMEEYNHDNISIRNLFSDLFEKNYYSLQPFGMSVSTWLIIFTLSSIYIYTNIEQIDKKKFILFMISIFVGLCVYICFLQVAYVLEFTETHAMEHNSLQRYMGTFLTAILFVLVGIILDSMNKNNEKFSKYLILLCILLVFTPISPIADSTIVAGTYNDTHFEGIRFDQNNSDKLSKVFSVTDRIYPVHQTHKLDTHLFRLRYFLTPIYIPIMEIFSEDCKIDINRWNNILYNDYDYVYILKIDEYFENNYKDLFSNKEIKEWSLYEIVKDNSTNSVELVLVEY